MAGGEGPRRKRTFVGEGSRSRAGEGSSSRADSSSPEEKVVSDSFHINICNYL